MKRHLSIIALCTSLVLSGCDGETTPDTNSPQYKAGYDDGLVDGENNICRQINSDRSQIHDWLRDHKICGN